MICFVQEFSRMEACENLSLHKYVNILQLTVLDIVTILYVFSKNLKLVFTFTRQLLSSLIFFL